MLTEATSLPVAQAARLFGLLADETRLRLLLTLADAEEGVAVEGLAKTIGMSQPALSYHLQQLRLGGAVTRRREGKNAFYSLAPGFARELLRHVRP